ncbi:MAG: GNAT family N-acetyltransferase [Nanoarchaeota archaeon]
MTQSDLSLRMQENAWVNLKIRKAVPQDAQKVYEIANSLKINKENPQKNGFLVYVTDLEGYKKRIEHTPYFYIAERDGEAIGFMFCFDEKVLTKLVQKKIITGEDETFSFYFGKKKQFVLVDQLGVQKQHTNQGVGKALFDAFFKDIIGKRCDVYAEILHKPIRNNSTIGFCKSIGFNEITEIANADKNTWGIYHIPSEL